MIHQQPPAAFFFLGIAFITGFGVLVLLSAGCAIAVPPPMA
jgi:hypothetical protein